MFRGNGDRGGARNCGAGICTGLFTHQRRRLARVWRQAGNGAIIVCSRVVRPAIVPWCAAWTSPRCDGRNSRLVLGLPQKFKGGRFCGGGVSN